MASRRLSRLQRHILQRLLAHDQLTQGRFSIGHLELVQLINRDKSNISHSLRTLETRGFITMGRTPGGKAEYVVLTSEGRKLASELA